MSGSQSNKPFVDIYKDHLLKESKVFCPLPWAHLHVTPFGAATPCCIAESCSTREGLGDATKLNLMELVNTDGMKKLRLDMLNGTKNHECKKCHEHEEVGVQSFRKVAIERYKHIIDDVLNTNDDGSVDTFNLRYYDMRFSNICNFKCRTCGQEFSSQWEQENLRSGVSWGYVNPKNKNTTLLNDVIDQIDFMEHAYFAGGEPLIMEEHYILLEEMIRRNRTDIQLNYNSNISNLKYKNKDLVELWSHFTKPISISASIDHIKERAEYIRSGTDWGVVEANFKQLKTLPYVDMTMNTVLSVFNFLTFDQFYGYLLDNDLYEQHYSVYNMSNPEHLTCHILPPKLKRIGYAAMKNTVGMLGDKELHQGIQTVDSANKWAMSKNTTYDYLSGVSDTSIEMGDAPTNISLFQSEIERLDKLRGENFEKIFPELTLLLDL